ncbi:MAG: twin-arginine translocase subunit TatC [Chloroflexi bacterium]|nr:twin-arginine translocase subunit TatC [Chloroflexota bacterium]
MTTEAEATLSTDVEMTLWEHLNELRSRMVKAAIALVVTTAVSVVFTPQALRVLIAPLGEMIPQTITPTESFLVYFHIALLGGVTLSMPIIVYQVIRFILPGLLPHEKKYLYFLLPGVGICFAGGVAFAGLIMLPAAINFMQGFLSTIIENRWTLNNYIGFVTRVLFWMGMVFQTPLIIFFLAKLGVVTPKMLSRYRKWAILAISIIAALVTPTPDPVNMTIVMVPLYLLYEVGVVLARLATLGRKEEDKEATKPAG